MPMQKDQNTLITFDSKILQNQSTIPPQFIWPHQETHHRQDPPPPPLHVPPIDLRSFLSGDRQAVTEAAKLVDSACREHGFFLVVNHEVEPRLIEEAHKYAGLFFEMPLKEKMRAERKAGENFGYASSFTNRFKSKLPWKETLSFRYSSEEISSSNMVEDYFLDVMGEDFGQYGRVYQEYCEAMSNLSLGIMELLGVSLGVGASHFREFYEKNDSIMRLNYYPSCQKPDLTLGTGPHCDPTSLTILHQDHVSGLQVFVHQKWHSILPTPHAFVVNIGDTFMALSNGIYKSCLHRAVVNSQSPRKSLAFFLSPKMSHVITPPKSLLVNNNNYYYGGQRVYPDFTWSTLLQFTQKHYRADMKTLDAFTNWLHQTNNI